jgi:hypothetical protein
MALRILQPNGYAPSFLTGTSMPAPRINMRKIKDVLRLKLDAKLSHQQIADALGLSKGVVTKYAGLAAAAGLDWPAVQSMDEAALERRLMVGSQKVRDYVQPDYGRVHHELRRKGMTLMLLWEEHRMAFALPSPADRAVAEQLRVDRRDSFLRDLPSKLASKSRAQLTQALDAKHADPIYCPACGTGHLRSKLNKLGRQFWYCSNWNASIDKCSATFPDDMGIPAISDGSFGQ